MRTEEDGGDGWDGVFKILAPKPGLKQYRDDVDAATAGKMGAKGGKGGERMGDSSLPGAMQHAIMICRQNERVPQGNVFKQFYR